MKSLLLAGAMIIATGACAFAQGGYWVVGDSATSKCEIVTSNPVINSQVGGNITFGTGPLQIDRRRQTGPFDDPPMPDCARTSCRTGAGGQEIRLVDGVAAAGHSVEAYCCIELRQFRLKLLVHPQQRLERSADVAIATRYDLIDGGFACVGYHGLLLRLYAEPICSRQPCSCGFRVRRGRWLPPNQARPHMAKVSTQFYKVADDALMTPLSTESAACGQLPKPAADRAVARWCKRSGHFQWWQ